MMNAFGGRGTLSLIELFSSTPLVAGGLAIDAVVDGVSGAELTEG